MATPSDEHEYGPIALAERILEVLFDQLPPPIAQESALNIAQALLPYRQEKLRRAQLAEARSTRLTPPPPDRRPSE